MWHQTLHTLCINECTDKLFIQSLLKKSHYLEFGRLKFSKALRKCWRGKKESSRHVLFMSWYGTAGIAGDKLTRSCSFSVIALKTIFIFLYLILNWKQRKKKEEREEKERDRGKEGRKEESRQAGRASLTKPWPSEQILKRLWPASYDSCFRGKIISIKFGPIIVGFKFSFWEVCKIVS